VGRFRGRRGQRAGRRGRRRTFGVLRLVEGCVPSRGYVGRGKVPVAGERGVGVGRRLVGRRRAGRRTKVTSSLVYTPLMQRNYADALRIVANGACGLLFCATTGGLEFNAVPAATGRSRHDRSRSTWGLVSRSIGSISNLVFRHLA
jgi:hypothetical protein